MEEKHFCRCLQAFSTKEVLKRHNKDCVKINGKQKIRIPKRREYVRFKNWRKKIKPPFIIYADFESILIPGDNAKQNPYKFLTNKYQEHYACSYGFKGLWVDDKFFVSYLGEDNILTF